MAGTVNISRGIWRDTAFKPQPFTEREAFMWLIMEASYKPREKRVGNVTVNLVRGQLAASIRFMADAWNWEKSTVDRFLKRLEKRDMIGTESGAGISVITICKYNDYQSEIKDSETDENENRDSSGTAAGQQRDKPNKGLIKVKEYTAAASADAEIQPQGFRSQLLEAMGVDPASGLTGRGGQMIGTQADMATAARWLAMPAMTEAAIVAEVSRKASTMKSKPGSFSYFTGAMQDLSAALSAPPLEASQVQPRKSGTQNDRSKFGAAINRLADDLSSGAVRIDYSSRDPFAAQRGKLPEAH